MELALNLIWLAIACGAIMALTRWNARQPDGTASRRRRRTVAFAVLCLLALLFPIISITDDLANDVLLVQASVNRRAPHDSAHRERIVTAVPAVVLCAPRFVFELTSRVLARFESFAPPVCGVLPSLTARAPPDCTC